MSKIILNPIRIWRQWRERRLLIEGYRAFADEAVVLAEEAMPACWEALQASTEPWPPFTAVTRITTGDVQGRKQ